MAEISFDPIDEQELFTTDSLNNRFRTGANSLQVAINDIEENALAPGALNENHLPSLVLFRGQISQPSPPLCQYTHGNTPWPGTWTGIDSNGETGGGTAFEVGLGASYNLSSGQAQGVFVLADLFVQHIRQNTTTYNDLDGVGFRIQAYNGAAWETISRTERFVSAQIYGGSAASQSRAINSKVPIRTLIRVGDISGSGGGTANVVSKVRVQVSVKSFNDSTNTTATLLSRSLTAIVLQSTRT